MEATVPAPNSWAADPSNEVEIWTFKMAAGAQWTLPIASREANRTLYFFKGKDIVLESKTINVNHGIQLWANEAVTIINGDQEAHFLMLQGKPINEPVVQYGPFVMNTEREIHEAMSEFQTNQFGGWPWPSSDNVHPRSKGRFAVYADGTEESKE